MLRIVCRFFFFFFSCSFPLNSFPSAVVVLCLPHYVYVWHTHTKLNAQSTLTPTVNPYVRSTNDTQNHVNILCIYSSNRWYLLNSSQEMKKKTHQIIEIEWMYAMQVYRKSVRATRLCVVQSVCNTYLVYHQIWPMLCLCWLRRCVNTIPLPLILLFICTTTYNKHIIHHTFRIPYWEIALTLALSCVNVLNWNDRRIIFFLSTT